MNSLMKQIENNIFSAITEFSQKIADKYDINKDELIDIWNSIGQTNPSTPISENNNSNTKIPQTKTKENNNSNTKIPQTKTKENISDTESTEGCPYLFTKGAREGENCGSKPKNGSEYCSRHKKHEGLEPKQKKVLPVPKKSVNTKINDQKSTPPTKSQGIILRKNKILDMIWHVETGMVFKSENERVVIGKCIDDKLLPLNDNDINICMAHSFKYEKSKIIEEDEDDKDDKDDEEEKLDEDEDNISLNATEAPKSNTTNKNIIKNSKNIKKSVANAIYNTNIQSKDIEDILGELQLPNNNKKFSDEEDLSEEEYEEQDLSEEEYEEELSEEED